MCGQLSRRVYGHYDRILKDLPWQGFAVRVMWRSQEFFCDEPSCRRRIFTERSASIASTYSRKTEILTVVFQAIVMASGGQAGSKLACRLGIPINVTRYFLKRVECRSILEVRAIGVDDWAYCKGRRYSTLICNLERGERLELLPDRDAD